MRKNYHLIYYSQLNCRNFSGVINGMNQIGGSLVIRNRKLFFNQFYLLLQLCRSTMYCDSDICCLQNGGCVMIWFYFIFLNNFCLHYKLLSLTKTCCTYLNLCQVSICNKVVFFPINHLCCMFRISPIISHKIMLKTKSNINLVVLHDKT